MQRERPLDPYQVVWPVDPNSERVIPDRASATVETPVLLPAEILLRYNARILDPATATQPKRSRRLADNAGLGRDDDGGVVRYLPTAYVANQVLVSSAGRDANRLRAVTEELNGALRKAATSTGRSFTLRPPEPADLELVDERLRTGSPAVLRLTIESGAEDSLQPPPDAWDVVQILRDEQSELSLEVGLNHLLFAAGVGGVGFTFGHAAGGVGFTFGHAVGPGEYAMPGLGGRMPVRVLGRPPRRAPLTRRPVVAILDTGVARHHWFDAPADDPIVERLRYDTGTGRVEPADDLLGGEDAPNIVDPLEGMLDPFFGHGTFIAGLVNQNCPDARISSIKVMATDGIVEEASLINCLGYLHQRQAAAQAAGEAGIGQLVDIVSLSLGFYPEAPAELGYGQHLRDALDALAGLGVLVVAAAGNDATSRPLLPAGFAPFSSGRFVGDPKVPPLVSVGALNPDGSVALFSNDGDWVACHCPGAALVSTLPIVDVGQRSGIDLSTGPAADLEVGTWRATLDPDNFTGFGTWSGTSFAAPVLAGAAAQALVDEGVLGVVMKGSSPTVVALSSLGFDLAVV